MSVLIRHETLIKSVKVHVGNTWHGRDRTVYGNARFVYEGKKHEELLGRGPQDGLPPKLFPQESTLKKLIQKLSCSVSFQLWHGRTENEISSRNDFRWMHHMHRYDWTFWWFWFASDENLCEKRRGWLHFKWLKGSYTQGFKYPVLGPTDRLWWVDPSLIDVYV